MYKETKNKKEIIRIEDNATIPCDEKNKDYIAYLKYKNDGGVISPAISKEESDNMEIILNNESIKAELLAADLSIIRAIVEDNKERIATFKLEQSERRRRLIPPGE